MWTSCLDAVHSVDTRAFDVNDRSQNSPGTGFADKHVVHGTDLDRQLVVVGS